MVRLPRSLSDVILLADWLELTAMESPDGNASAGDLASALQIMPAPDSPDDLLQQVMLELEHRQNAAAAAYPFSIEGASVLQCKGDWQAHIPYVFCLCLSYFGREEPDLVTLEARRLFEELSAVAAAQYVQGRAVNFGRACERGTRPFETAVGELCKQLREGKEFSRYSSKRAKDDAVDIVAWKPFPDRWSSQLVLFGQCATGKNWDGKLNDMQPESFWKLWIAEPNVSPLIRSFYVPHRVHWDDWVDRAMRSGILFDRCRIAYWAGLASADWSAEYSGWCRTAFAPLGSA